MIMTGKNPLLGLDFPDVDVIRVEDTYYMISTTMYFMPGGVILRSYDLIHWEYAARVYDILEDTDAHRLEDGHGIYSSGMWAASLRYHEGMFYVCFVANDTHKTYLYRSPSVYGPWKRNYIEGFYQDCSLLFDDDGRVYIAYGHRQIYITELNSEMTGPKVGGLHRMVADFGPSDQLPYEGAHLYHINNKYYLFLIHSLKECWKRVETCLCSDRLDGTFTGGIVFNDDMGFFNQGVAQGGIVDTPEGRWFAVLFQDRGACGRIPVLVPVKWEDEWPVFGTDGKVPLTVSNDSSRPEYSYAPLVGSDDFTEEKLKDIWEWNHVPENSLWSVGKGRLTITTGKICTNLTLIRNILTQRAYFPACRASVHVDGSQLGTGDTAGICVLQYQWAYIGLQKLEKGYRLVKYVCNSEAEEYQIRESGELQWTIPWEENCVRLCIGMDFTDLKDQAEFFYECGSDWRQCGSAHPMLYSLKHFTGNRFGLFVMSGEKAGGTAIFKHFIYSPLEDCTK